MRRSRIALAALAGLMTAAAAANLATEFGYGENNGPDVWCELDEGFALCCEGTSQSPIDIVEDDVIREELPRLRFQYRSVGLTAFHNGETIRADVPDGKGKLRVGKAKYELDQFHFHTPSEHRIDGIEAPAEIHLVHTARDGATLVVAVLLEEGSHHRELQKIWRNLPEEEGDTASVRRFDLAKLITGTRSYRYDGSFTTPPCSEDVRWVVLADPMEMSAEQLSALQEVFSGEEFPEGNRRPPQDLNDRTVCADSDPRDHGGDDDD